MLDCHGGKRYRKIKETYARVEKNLQFLQTMISYQKCNANVQPNKDLSANTVHKYKKFNSNGEG
jgi:hypothetical protein